MNHVAARREGIPLHHTPCPALGPWADPGAPPPSGDCQESSQGWHSPSGDALGARGAGRFFVLGLLVGVMPYHGCKDLGVDSGWA